MKTKKVNQIARNIFEQFQSFSPSVRGSWGTHDLKADCIKPGQYEMAALTFLVQGFAFKGRLWIALNEGSDLYEIYGQRQGQHHMQLLDEDVFFDDLEAVLDSLIETGCQKGQEFYAKEHTFAEVVNSIISGTPLGETPEEVPCEEVTPPVPSASPDSFPIPATVPSGSPEGSHTPTPAPSGFPCPDPWNPESIHHLTPALSGDASPDLSSLAPRPRRRHSIHDFI